MKLAVITDAHGNYHGLEAVLNDIEKEKPDCVISAGDMINPLPASLKTWDRWKREKIPMILGNNEELVITYHAAEPHVLIKESVRFRPTQNTAKKFSPADVSEMQLLPLNRVVEGPNGDDVLICHASPLNLHKCLADEIDQELEVVLKKIEANTIVIGHYHKPWHTNWMKKRIIMSGSCGWPQTGKIDVDYLILEHVRNNWTHRHKSVPYDHESAIRNILNSGFLEHAGPFGLLYFAEFIFFDSHIMPFFRSTYRSRKPQSYGEWDEAVTEYLKSVNMIGVIESTVRNHHCGDNENRTC